MPNNSALALLSLPPAAVVVAAAAEEEEQQEDDDYQCGGTHGGGQPITASHRRLSDSDNRHRLGFMTLPKNMQALTDGETKNVNNTLGIAETLKPGSSDRLKA